MIQLLGKPPMLPETCIDSEAGGLATPTTGPAVRLVSAKSAPCTLARPEALLGEPGRVKARYRNRDGSNRSTAAVSSFRSDSVPL